MTLAGSKGGIYWGDSDPGGYDIPVVRAWRDIGERNLTGAELFCDLLQHARPTQVEIGIGNTCGLECAHCFLGYGSGDMAGKLVPLETLAEVSTEFIEDFGSRIFCVTDRDALTPRRSVPFFEHLAGLRRRYPDLKFGGVTNGLALNRFADDLERIRLDYLDISVDGLRHEHDAVRGQGTFDRVLEGLRSAVQRGLAERVMVATTLTRLNHASLIVLIRRLIEEEGVQWFDVGPLMAVKMKAYQLGPTDAARFLSDLADGLKDVRPGQPTTVFFEICAYCAAFIPSLIDSGWLVPERLRQDRYGHIYQDIRVNSDITLTLRPELIPEYWRHNLRITADGYVVGGCEPLTQPDYARHAIGNIKDEPLKAIYAKALAIGSPFYRMMRAYDNSECRERQCFRHCLGGDSLLSKAVYDNFNIKDPNCNWEEYRYEHQQEAIANAS
jgi:MoaA/NifB/PqqE/SkfB family radical SAM enzyme